MLKLENITAGYNKVPVISDISIEFEQGRITTIIGPNGSGKSTLLKAIADLCDIWSGSLYLNGKSRKEIGRKEYARQLTYLSQSRQAGAITVSRMVLHGRFPHLSYPRHYTKEDFEHCRRAMERVGILPLRDKKVEELSGGQKQKVYLAMALAGDADTLLLDEPATYLDIRYQLELLEMMRQLKEQGKTVIAVLHDLNYAMHVSDRIVVLNNGRIVMQGTPQQIHESGIINEVFQINAGNVEGADGRKHYYFDLQD
jgi:ABC-type cobalamin/Fe3+-siderophores transport system ATPase subunit